MGFLAVATEEARRKKKIRCYENIKLTHMKQVVV